MKGGPKPRAGAAGGRTGGEVWSQPPIPALQIHGNGEEGQAGPPLTREQEAGEAQSYRLELKGKNGTLDQVGKQTPQITPGTARSTPSATPTPHHWAGSPGTPSSPHSGEGATPNPPRHPGAMLEHPPVSGPCWTCPVRSGSASLGRGHPGIVLGIPLGRDTPLACPHARHTKLCEAAGAAPRLPRSPSETQNHLFLSFPFSSSGGF